LIFKAGGKDGKGSKEGGKGKKRKKKKGKRRAHQSHRMDFLGLLEQKDHAVKGLTRMEGGSRVGKGPEANPTRMAAVNWVTRLSAARRSPVSFLSD